MIIIGLSVLLFFVVSYMINKYLKFKEKMYEELIELYNHMSKITERLNFIVTILEIDKQKNMAQQLNNATKRDRFFLWN